MAISFPNGLDTFNNPAGTDHLDTPAVKHSVQHSNINDAIEAIEEKLGVDFSNVNTTIDYVCNLFLMTATQHPEATFKEIEYHPVNKIMPTSITWYLDMSKTVMLVKKEFTYGHPVPILPNVITLKIYDGSYSNNLMRTIVDNVVYSGVVETERHRFVA